jgi:hypothetical protein
VNRPARPPFLETAPMLRLLMAPANMVCDALNITDEHERGMMRMLVNMMILTALVVPVFYILWQLTA